MSVPPRRDRGIVKAQIDGRAFSGARIAGVGLDTDGEESSVRFFAGIPHVVSIQIILSSQALARYVYKRWKKRLPGIRVVSVDFDSRAVWWSFWQTWTKEVPRWRHGSFNWWDWLTGKPNHLEIIEGPVEVSVSAPEGSYQALVELRRDVWIRSRWPWPTVGQVYGVKVLVDRPCRTAPM